MRPTSAGSPDSSNTLTEISPALRAAPDGLTAAGAATAIAGRRHQGVVSAPTIAVPKARSLVLGRTV